MKFIKFECLDKNNKVIYSDAEVPVFYCLEKDFIRKAKKTATKKFWNLNYDICHPTETIKIYIDETGKSYIKNREAITGNGKWKEVK